MIIAIVLFIIKVFRLQRKTLLLFLGFFFPIIIIKVFRSNGRPYCYSIVSFSLLLLLLLLFFFLLDFSEMRGRISLKFSEVVGTGLA